MTTNDVQALPSPPSLIGSFRTGFDAITNHISLILFPIALDLFIWLGPHLRLTQLIHTIVDQMNRLSALQEPQTEEMLRASTEIWTLIGERFNLLVLLRSYPVGIPSLMAARLPVEMPFGSPAMWEVSTLLGAMAAWGMITLIGLAAGTLFYGIVSQAALNGQVRWISVLERWPNATLQVVFLTVFWVVLLLGASIPGSLLISLFGLGGLALAQCALLMYVGFVLWLLFPLLFSTHGIFVNGANVINSLKSSVRLTRMTLPTTGLFILLAILLSQGLDLLWEVPEETSWLTLVGITGHAFVTTGLLAASFVYYQDASRWVQQLSEKSSFTVVQDLLRKS